MFISGIKNKTLKISFGESQEKLAIGDFLRVNTAGKTVLAQVFEVTCDGQGDGNSALSKIILIINEQNQLCSWQGEIIPSRSKIRKVSAEAILSLINNEKDMLSLGYTFGGNAFKIDSESFLKPTVVFYDSKAGRIAALEQLSIALAQNDKKTVIFDFIGELSEIGDSVKAEAGKNFKLALDSQRLENLKELLSENTSAEIKVLVDDIFSSLQEYISSSTQGFIPYSALKSVIKSEYEENRIPELAVIKNKLIKFDREGIFANTEFETQALKYCIDNNNIVIVNLSGIPVFWQKDFLNFIIDSNNTNKQNFSLFVDAGSLNVDESIKKSLFCPKPGIVPFVLVPSYHEKSFELLSNADNCIIAESPSSDNLQSKYKGFTELLDGYNLLLAGSVTENIPFILKPDWESSIEELSEEKAEQPEIKAPPDYIPQTKEEFLKEDREEEPVFEEELAGEEQEESQEESFSFEEYSIDEDEDLNFETIEPEQSEESEDYDYSLEEEPEQDEIPQETRKATPEPEGPPIAEIPVFPAEEENEEEEFGLSEGDTVRHEKYGIGVIKKIIGYGNKKLCSIQFKNVGKRLLDPQLAYIEKINK